MIAPRPGAPTVSYDGRVTTDDAPSLERVLEAVRRDAAQGRFAAWGCSTVIDENVGAAVVDRDLFDLLHTEAGLRAEFPVGNAGLLHVYGYLFSEVVTPYGRKRDRWNDGVLARRLGLPPGAFVLGDSAEETPLERVTRETHALVRTPPADAFVVDETVDGVATRAVIARSGALAYAVDGRLVTLFPVDDPAGVAAGVESAPGRLRWNAVVPR